MPKEIVHWLVARRTADFLNDSAYGPALRDEPDSLALGAVFHDVLFYGLGRSGMKLVRLAQEWHGRQGENTYDILDAQIGHVRRRAPDLGPVAALVGLVSHIQTDADFHPLVYYHAGRSKVRHRAMESLMDMMLSKGRKAKRRHSLSGMLDRMAARDRNPLELFPLPEMARMGGMGAKELRLGFSRALKLFARMQRTYAMPAFSSLGHATSLVMPEGGKAVAALFYSPILSMQAAALGGEIEFRHPVTGESAEISLLDLVEESAVATAAYCLKIRPWVFGDAKGPPPGPGPSLYTGIVGVGPEKMTTFSSKPLVRFP